MSTQLCVIVNGHRLVPNLELPPELDDVELDALQLVTMVRRDANIVSFSGHPQVTGMVMAVGTNSAEGEVDT